MAKKRVTVTLTHKKDTKGTRVWGNDDAAITQLYIRRPDANDLPDKITVIVEGA